MKKVGCNVHLGFSFPRQSLLIIIRILVVKSRMGRAKRELEEVNRLDESKDSTEYDVSIRVMESKKVLKLNVVEK